MIAPLTIHEPLRMVCPASYVIGGDNSEPENDLA